MAIIDDIEDEMARQLADEIDAELIADMLVAGGWTKVPLNFRDRYHSVDILIWVEDNCTGKHQRCGKYFVFQESKDAEWFMLRWL
jgi:hypothetical protein